MVRVLKHAPQHVGYNARHIEALFNGHLSGVFGSMLKPGSKFLYSPATYAAAGKAWPVLREAVMRRVTAWNTSRNLTACLHPDATIRPWAYYKFDTRLGDLLDYDGNGKAMLAAQDLRCRDEAEYLATYCRGELTDAEWAVRALPYTPPVVRGVVQ